MSAAAGSVGEPEVRAEVLSSAWSLIDSMDPPRSQLTAMWHVVSLLVHRCTVIVTMARELAGVACSCLTFFVTWSQERGPLRSLQSRRTALFAVVAAIQACRDGSLARAAASSSISFSLESDQPHCLRLSVPSRRTFLGNRWAPLG